MVLDTLKRLTAGPKPVVVLFLLLLTSLYLMSGATQNSAAFGRMYSLLLGVNILALALLVALIGRNIVGLVQSYRRRAVGARLTLRLVVMFTVLAVSPVLVVYSFSLEFLQRGIDSWFDARIESALEDALELGQRSLDDRLREQLRQSRRLAAELGDVDEEMMPLVLNDLRKRAKASEMTLMSPDGRIVASSSADPADIVPAMPNQAILRQLRQGLDYAGLAPHGQSGLQVRIAVAVPRDLPRQQGWILHALYPVAQGITELAASVQGAYGRYKELAFLREPLKYSFTLTLSLILLLSVLTAVWAAFFSARRLVAPIRDLAAGTRAVAAGDYDKRLPLPGRDELGYLVRSFNEMTRKIALSRDQASRSQQQVESQRAYLEAVLKRLSSGVITLDASGALHTVNAAAVQILGVPLDGELGTSLDDVAEHHPALAAFVQAITPFLADDVPEWREEIVLFGETGRQVLMCRGSSLGAPPDNGHVIVFDDITALIQAQRDAAWGEVARRLAHEIKNPLTPIQLSAERLRRKYLAEMPPADAEVLDRATGTIVQQVEAMKEMVKAFSEYARAPTVELRPVDLNAVVADTLELYREDPRATIETSLADNLPLVNADAGRLRQLIHNLLKNAIESSGRVHILMTTQCARRSGCTAIELHVEDDGPGIPEHLLGRLFDPYVTTKQRGTGLGLAIVKKIVEEHGGMIGVSNRPGGGARITIRLPVGGGNTPARPGATKHRTAP